MTGLSRKFLAVSDETEECRTAILFAGLRARAVGAGLVILRCAETPGLGGWIGLDRDITRDALDTARLKANAHAALVEERTGIQPEVVVSDQEPLDAIRKVVDGDPLIRALVLASGSGRHGPGPLVSRLGKGKPLSHRPLAVTVVPGKLNDREIEEMGGVTA